MRNSRNDLWNLNHNQLDLWADPLTKQERIRGSPDNFA